MIRVGITQGDTNGIGYEVILKMLEDTRITELCTPIVYGSAKVASFYRKLMDLPPVQLNQVENAAQARDGAVSIINVVGEDLKVEPGVPSEEAGMAAFAALERAVADLRDGQIDVLVTAPINKKNIQSGVFVFPGHTEYLQSTLGDGQEALMVLCDESLRVALVTGHIPLAEVPSTITKDLILNKLEIFNQSLKRDFGIVAPRIAVLSLNPHAGEQNMLGREEQTVIAPALEEARERRILAFGPYASDGFFGSNAYKHFDGVLAMYHDQGLTAFKALSMQEGVNFTAGLPFVRTSPDHGTGYDIAGKGLADPQSMRSAIYAAVDILRAREDFDRARMHPLKRQYFDKGSDKVKLDLTKEE